MQLFLRLRPGVLGAALAATGVVPLWSTEANAKIPGSIHCYNDICHRIRTVEETAARRGIVEPVVASFYDAPERDPYNPSLETSSGARFEADADDNAASPIHPDGTILLVWSPATHAAAIVRVNNAGPYYPGRTLDVSRGVAERLGFGRRGTMTLLTTVIAAPNTAEATYVRARVYPKVRGFIGRFDNIAVAGLAEPVAREAIFHHLPRWQAPAQNTSGQILQTVTEEHIRLSGLATDFDAVPAEIMPPQTSGALETEFPLPAGLDVGAQGPLAAIMAAGQIPGG